MNWYYYLRLPARRGAEELGPDFFSPAAVREEAGLADLWEADLGAERRVLWPPPPPEGALRPLGIGSALISGLTAKPGINSFGKRCSISFSISANK